MRAQSQQEEPGCTPFSETPPGRQKAEPRRQLPFLHGFQTCNFGTETLFQVFSQLGPSGEGSPSHLLQISCAPPFLPRSRSPISETLAWVGEWGGGDCLASLSFASPGRKIGEGSFLPAPHPTLASQKPCKPPSALRPAAPIVPGRHWERWDRGSYYLPARRSKATFLPPPVSAQRQEEKVLGRGGVSARV